MTHWVGVYIACIKRNVLLLEYILSLNICSLRNVNWEPLLTRHIVDDFASHLRLYRKAKEKVKQMENNQEGDLESVFFDLELDMEKTYCRDSVSTSPKYENGQCSLVLRRNPIRSFSVYLHDVADILLYLLIPAEDFRARPFRFLLREIVVKRLFLPVLDLFSEPDYINYIIVWLARLL